jgi:hypothetical protein
VLACVEKNRDKAVWLFSVLPHHRRNLHEVRASADNIQNL